jgi:hypothetical protein
MSRFVFAAALVCAAPAYAETRYFSELSDVPMPPGFEESDTAVGFDGAGGRLVMARAAGDLPSQEVRSFYAECLPALGWALVPRTDGVLMFQRGRERLTFTIRTEAGRTLLGADLIVSLAPMNAD